MLPHLVEGFLKRLPARRFSATSVCCLMAHILLELAHAWVQAVKAALFSISAHHFLSIACFPACMNCCKKRKHVAACEVPWDHLVVTDVRWASPPSSSSGSFYETFWELSRLGVILQEGVDAFDFMSCLARNTQISLAARQHGFDVIVKTVVPICHHAAVD